MFMSFKIKRIRFENFRNHTFLELGELKNLNIIYGSNAEGKTNIIEGIELLSSLSSFRNPKTNQLINENALTAHISIDIEDKKRELSLLCDISNGSRKYFLNGNHRSISELKGIIPCVCFTPDDLNLAKGSFSIRRNSLDNLGSQISKNYYTIKKDYEKLLRYKNCLLKEEASDSLILSVNDTLVICGAQLIYYRFSLFKKMYPEISSYYKNISQGKEEFQGQYKFSWDILNQKEFESLVLDVKSDKQIQRLQIEEQLSYTLSDFLQVEKDKKRSIIGPHADRIEFSLNKKPIEIYGSQGQQRCLVLAFKMAETKVIENSLSQKPLLLLDDVMSELDEQRRNCLMQFFKEDIQTFITTTNLSYFQERDLKEAHLVKLPFNNY